MIHTTEGVNSNKNQKAILKQGHPNLLNQRNFSEQRNIQYKPTPVHQQQNGLILEQSISQIQQGSSCQIQYFFPKSVKRGARNKTPGNDSKNTYCLNEKGLMHAKSGDCDFKTTQAQFCEVDINLLQKKDNLRKPVSNSVAQSLASKNMNDLLNQQKRSSSSKAINSNNLTSTQVNLQESLNKQQQLSSAQKGQSRTPKNNKIKINSQLTPSLERKKNSNSVISNKRSISINKQVAQQLSQGSQKKNDKQIITQQQSKQPQIRLASKSSLQKNRKPQISQKEYQRNYIASNYKQIRESIRYRIKTVGNEEDDSDEGFNPEHINLNNLDDNDTPLSKFKDVVFSNQKQNSNDLQNPSRYPPKIKFQRDVGRVQGNIQECNVLKNFINQVDPKQQQLKAGSNQNKPKDSSDKSPNAKLINTKQGNMSGNQLIKNDNLGVEINRIRAISSNGVRKRILTKSNEKLRTNLHINTDNYCEIDLPQQSLYQAGGAATTTLDSKGSTKHTITNKFSSRTDTQSVFNNNKQQLSNNPKQVKVISLNEKGIQSRVNRIKTEGDEGFLNNYSPNNPKTYNVNNYLHLSNKIEEDRLFRNDNLQCQPQSNKSHNSDALLFTSQKKNQNKSNQDIKYNENDQQRQSAMDLAQNKIISNSENDQMISPQFQKLRFKNTQSITYERNYSADDYASRNTQNQELNNNLKQIKKKKLMIKTINPYKSEEKKEISSQSETPSSAHSSIMFSSIGNNNGLLTKNNDVYPKSPLSLRKSDGTNIVKSQNQQGIYQSQYSSISQNFQNVQNVRESINSDYQNNQIYQSVQHNNSSKKIVDWYEITSPNNINICSDRNSNPRMENKKPQKILLRPTKVTSNERKNNNNSSNGSRSHIKQPNNVNPNNQLLQSQSLSNNQIGFSNYNNQFSNQKDYFSVPIQQMAPQQNQFQDSSQQKNYFSTQKFTNEFHLSVETFQPSENKEKNQSINSLLSSSNNFNNIFNSNKSNDVKELKTIKQQINFYNNVDEDQVKQKQILESIKSDAMKSILRQSIEKGKDQSQFQSDSIQELQKDLNEMKLNVQIENMNQNFATLNKNLKEMNNDLNLDYSNLIPRDSRSHILDNIDSYHFDKIPENENENNSNINCHVSILNNNQQDSFKYTNETTQYDHQQADKMQMLVNNFEFSEIQDESEDKDIISQLEREKTEFEQKLLQEKIKFEQRQQQLQQEFINQKQKLLQQQQMRLKNNNNSNLQVNPNKNQFEQNQQQSNFTLSPFSSQDQQDAQEQISNQQKQNQNLRKNHSFTNSSSCGYKMLQFADKSLDLSFTKNPNLENDVSKLFRQEQISQILPESQCSFLSEAENILETNNNSSVFVNGANQFIKNQNMSQCFSQDGLNVIHLQNQSSAKNQNQSNKFLDNHSNIQKQNFFPTISPQSSTQSFTDKQFKQSICMNQQQFPNIHVNANMVNIPKQFKKNNYQIHDQFQQQLIIEEQDCEQSHDISLQVQHQQQNRLVNFNSQNSNRMPPLPVNINQLQKLKKKSLHQAQQKFQNYKS